MGSETSSTSRMAKARRRAKPRAARLQKAQGKTGLILELRPKFKIAVLRVSPVSPARSDVFVQGCDLPTPKAFKPQAKHVRQSSYLLKAPEGPESDNVSAPVWSEQVPWAEISETLLFLVHTL